MAAVDATFLESTDLAADPKRGADLPPIHRDPGSGRNGGGNSGHSDRPLHNGILAVALFIGADIMFFAGLIGSFMIFRFGAPDWPPPGQPLLPVGVTGFNTALLLLSGFTMIKTWQLLARENRNQIIRWLNFTAILGAVFLVIQGFEWLRLLSFGLKLSSGVYGATFYTIIGCHALHVLGAVIWLSVVTLRWRLNPNLYKMTHYQSIKIAGMYWMLVVGLWPVLYGLVYFS